MNKQPVTPEVREALRKIAERTTGWKTADTNIKKIVVNAFSKRKSRLIMTAICVGEQLDPDVADSPAEEVLAIFESTAYIVITPEKGMQGEMPYLFGKEKVLTVEKENA